jgi:hypothetical protein
MSVQSKETKSDNAVQLHASSEIIFNSTDGGRDVEKFLKLKKSLKF